MKNKLEDLRNHLFLSIEKLQEATDSDEIKLEVDKAKLIVDLSQQLINTGEL